LRVVIEKRFLLDLFGTEKSIDATFLQRQRTANQALPEGIPLGQADRMSAVR
jgi:hypothetical protein